MKIFAAHQFFIITSLSIRESKKCCMQMLWQSFLRQYVWVRVHLSLWGTAEKNLSGIPRHCSAEILLSHQINSICVSLSGADTAMPWKLVTGKIPYEKFVFRIFFLIFIKEDGARVVRPGRAHCVRYDVGVVVLFNVLFALFCVSWINTWRRPIRMIYYFDLVDTFSDAGFAIWSKLVSVT